MLFADRCGICGERGRSPCVACAIRLPPPPRLPVPDALDELLALFAYDHGGRTLITAIKYRNARGALPWIARELSHSLRAQAGEIITWVPASFAGRKRRGFDTGELLARRIGHELRLPVRPLLRRTRGEVQSTRTQAERLRGPAMRPMRAARKLRLGTVILVDDVATTGASLTAAAEALRECGFRYVVGAVAARTPLHATNLAV